ncbi:putative beta-lysine N-acetyltransferase [Dehalobacter sp. DCM]|uniref:putative beta-lysine N-acetyltransferase n=1 Tax=Dehalobacter sp. DCM TaxID=2907827 RepID=UPI0030820479|nr:putative beta-lysine N-acetyltransferase [Dehalobacter sp. DCM]
MLTSNSIRSTNPFIDRRNKRLVLDGYAEKAIPALSQKLIQTAFTNDLEKIWVWALPADVPIYLQQGFQIEGSLVQNNEENFSVSLAYYVSQSRSYSNNFAEEDKLLYSVRKDPIQPLTPLPAGMNLLLLDESFVSPISALLTQTFASYPTPVEDTDYIHTLFQKGDLFAGAIDDGKLVAVAAAYPDLRLRRCEMTDCATLENYRGLSLTLRLLEILENAIKNKIQSPLLFYTLARAQSYGMNRVFHKLGYRCQGRLINNCHIGGAYEDMNLWARI